MRRNARGFVFYDGVRANLVAQQLASVRIEGVLFNASVSLLCSSLVGSATVTDVSLCSFKNSRSTPATALVSSSLAPTQF